MYNVTTQLTERRIRQWSALLSTAAPLLLLAVAPAHVQFMQPGMPGMPGFGTQPNAQNVSQEPAEPKELVYKPEEMLAYAEGETELEQAVIAGDNERLRVLLRDTKAEEVRQKTLYPLAVLASVYGDLETFKLLNAYRVDLSASDVHGRNAIHYLAMKGESEIVKFLMIMSDKGVDEADDEGVTPLFYAYLNGQMQMANFLVDFGQAQINRVDRNGDPLAFKVVQEQDNYEAVQHMLQHNLNVFKRNRRDLSLAEVAELNEHTTSATMLKEAKDRIMMEFRQRMQQSDDASGGGSGVAPAQPNRQNQAPWGTTPRGNPGFPSGQRF